MRVDLGYGTRRISVVGRLGTCRFGLWCVHCGDLLLLDARCSILDARAIRLFFLQRFNPCSYCLYFGMDFWELLISMHSIALFCHLCIPRQRHPGQHLASRRFDRQNPPAHLTRCSRDQTVSVCPYWCHDACLQTLSATIRDEINHRNLGLTRPR